MPDGTVVLSVLNWGLGHASRCIPLARHLLDSGRRLVIAGDGPSLGLLRRELPGAVFENMPPYRIRYPSRLMTWNLALQAPSFLYLMMADHRRFRRIVDHYRPEITISDNRYGCYSPACPGIMITHQLDQPGLPPFRRKGFRMAVRRLLKPYRRIWVPDIDNDPGLSGALSHCSDIRGLRYIGIQSRIERMEGVPAYRTVSILSGPEPQRSRLERILLGELDGIRGRHVLVRGIYGGEAPPLPKPAQVRILASADSGEISGLLSQAETVICRSGYSSVMDLAAAGSKALLIPTPGQPEQEYLANHLAGKGYAVSAPQDSIALAQKLEECRQIRGFGEFRIGSRTDWESLLREAIVNR